MAAAIAPPVALAEAAAEAAAAAASGVEKDLDEVLQTTTVFHNVGKGVVAKDKELAAAFGITDQPTICLEILAKGELQVSDKERKIEYEHLFKDVAGVLVDKTVNPATHRPYTASMLERALRDIHFNLDPKKSAKQQALEALPLLQREFPIERARMRLKLVVPAEAQQELEVLLQREGGEVQSMDVGPGGACTVVAEGLHKGAVQAVPHAGPHGRAPLYGR
ncbi:Ribosome maturation protein SBDS, partial [Tetrabaena socialis]